MSLGLPSGVRGQVLALGLTVLAAAAVWAGIVDPIREWYDDRTELLRRQGAKARRMAALIETLPTLRHDAEQAARGTDTAAGTPAMLLSGATDSLAAAALQQRLDEFATASGSRIVSEEILPARPEGDLRAIQVRLTVTAPWRSLADLLLALARSEVPMAAEEIQLRGQMVSNLTGVPPDSGQTVDAILTVTAYRGTAVDPR